MVRGSCLCGGIRFEASEVALIGLCHCSRCRKAYGGPFEAGAAVRSEHFVWLGGKELIQVYESSPGLRRVFCRVCGSRAPLEAEDGVTFVPAGLFDGDPGVKPAFHMFVGSKAPWWEIQDELPQFPEWVPGYGPGEAK